MPKIIIAAFVAAFLATGCLYHQPIFQGNLLEQEKVEQLQAGMTKRQVFALLGSPSVADPFHLNRWDYLASQRRGHGDTIVKAFVVHFDGDVVSRWEGEYFPEQDLALVKEMGKFGNIAKDPKKKGR